MESRGYETFWSYAHVDDDRQGGAIRGLAAQLQAEFGLLTGDDLNMFIDRKDLKWGQVWRERIDSAIGEVPFLIAIVTPSFLRSQECRREILSFIGQARSRGQEHLLLPIVYTDIPDLNEDSDDELVSLVSRLQWESWSDLRLKDPNGPEVKQAVNRLAVRLRELQGLAETAREEDELSTEPEREESLEDVIREIDFRLDEWLDAVEGDRVKTGEWNAIISSRLEKVPRLQRARATPGAILSVYVRMGRDLDPIASQRLTWSKSYARLTIELDPFVRAAIRLVERLPQFAALLAPLRDGVREAMLAILQEGTGYAPIEEYVSYSAHLAAAHERYRSSLSYVAEGNEVVAQWQSLLQTLDSALRSDRQTQSDLRRSLSSQVPRKPERIEEETREPPIRALIEDVDLVELKHGLVSPTQGS